MSVETAKLTSLKNFGSKGNDPSTSQKSYWKIINRVVNYCRAPKIPPCKQYRANATVV